MTSTPPAPYGDCQFEIYAGLGGVVPALPMAYLELEARAAAALPPSVLSYVQTPDSLRGVTVPGISVP